MSARQEYGKAAAWFTAVMTLAGGAAGLVVAGLIVGLDYAVNGTPEGREQIAAARAARRRARYDDAFAWLEADRADRAARRAAYTGWMKQDPATRGAAPARSTSESLGHVLAWMTNSTVVAAGRFARGWHAGRAAAEDRRSTGEPRWWWPRVDSPEPAPQAEPSPAPAPRLQQPTEVPGTPPAPKPNNNIIDAEIIDDMQQASRDVVPAGQDTPRTGGLGVGSYDRRLADLEDEIAGDPGHPVDPSPPATALR